MSGPPTGAAIGARLAGLLGEATVKARAATAGPEQAIRDQARNAFMEAGEAHFQPAAAQIAARYADQPGLPPALKVVFERAANPGAQWDWLYQLMTLASFILMAGFQLGAPDVQETLNALWSANPQVPPTPAEAALAELRGVLTHDEAVAKAKMSGTSPADYATLVGITGEPPATQELLYLFRRGEIDAGRLERGIRQSRVRDEWIPYIEKLRFVPPSPAQAVAANVQGHLSDAKAREVYAQGGLDPDSYDWVFATAGRPAASGEMLDLWNRGEVDQATVEQAIRESDIKDKYIPALLKLARRIPPERTIVSMIGKGVKTPAEGIAMLRSLGFDQADAAALAAEAHTTKTAHVKTLTESIITNAYRDRMIDRPEAHSQLVALDYSGSDADQILDLADFHREERFVATAISRVHALYVSYRIDRSSASTTLDRVPVPAGQRDDLLRLWALERDVNTQQMSYGLMGRLTQRGLLSAGEMVTRLIGQGYHRSDAELIVALYAPKT